MFGVLAYYAVADAAARTLRPQEGRPARIIPLAGPAGPADCLLLAFAPPLSSVVAGVAVPAVGAAAYGVRRAVVARTS